MRALERASLTIVDEEERERTPTSANCSNGFRKLHMIRLPARAAERRERERRGDHLMSDSRGRQATVGHGERAHAVRTEGSREGGSVPSIFPPAVPGHREVGEEMDWAAGGRG